MSRMTLEVESVLCHSVTMRGKCVLVHVVCLCVLCVNVWRRTCMWVWVFVCWYGSINLIPVVSGKKRKTLILWAASYLFWGTNLNQCHVINFVIFLFISPYSSQSSHYIIFIYLWNDFTSLLTTRTRTTKNNNNDNNHNSNKKKLIRKKQL